MGEEKMEAAGKPARKTDIEKRVEEIQQSRRMARFRPASTLLLGSMYFPVQWLIDFATMANFWIVRIRNQHRLQRCICMGNLNFHILRR